MPVLIGEVCYEGIQEASRQEVQRFMFWSALLSGTGGHTYGANGIWQVNTREKPYGLSPHGHSWGGPAWDIAAQLPGSGQLGLAKALLTRYSWWKLEPQPDMIDPRWSKEDYWKPFAAEIPGEAVIAFTARFVQRCNVPQSQGRFLSRVLLQSQRMEAKTDDRQHHSRRKRLVEDRRSSHLSGLGCGSGKQVMSPSGGHDSTLRAGGFRVGFSADFLREDGSLAFPTSDCRCSRAFPESRTSFLREYRAEYVPEQLASYDVLISLKPRITPRSLEGVTRLCAIGRCGVGYDNVDLEACTEHGIAVYITPGGVVRPVAESIVLLVLALSHRLLHKDRHGAPGTLGGKHAAPGPRAARPRGRHHRPGQHRHRKRFACCASSTCAGFWPSIPMPRPNAPQNSAWSWFRSMNCFATPTTCW